jgi:hypothetical protein
MPKVKAYAGKGSLIPTYNAAVVDAYECPWTGKMYRTKENYVKHLSDLRQYSIHPRIRAANADKIKQTLWNLSSFEDVAQWIEDHSQFIFEQSRRRHFSDDPDAEKNFKLKITYLKLTWSDSVSNTHSCPHNGRTNWGGREVFKDGSPVPRGYPGWQGRIEYLRSHDISFSSSMLQPLRIHTGTGGGAGVKHPAGYEVRFYDADWPGLAALVKEQYDEYISNKVMSRLKNEYVSPFQPTIQIGEPSYFRH